MKLMGMKTGPEQQSSFLIQLMLIVSMDFKPVLSKHPQLTKKI